MNGRHTGRNHFYRAGGIVFSEFDDAVGPPVVSPAGLELPERLEAPAVEKERDLQVWPQKNGRNTSARHG